MQIAEGGNWQRKAIMFVPDVLKVILQRCSGLKASFARNREIYQLFVESFTGSLTNCWMFRHYQEGRIDLPEDGALFLQQLRTTNRVVLEKFGNSMKTHHTYKWSKREGMEEGSTIQSLIEQGIERPKLSNDVIGALFKVRYSE